MKQTNFFKKNANKIDYTYIIKITKKINAFAPKELFCSSFIIKDTSNISVVLKKEKRKNK